MVCDQNGPDRAVLYTLAAQQRPSCIGTRKPASLGRSSSTRSPPDSHRRGGVFKAPPATNEQPISKWLVDRLRIWLAEASAAGCALFIEV